MPERNNLKNRVQYELYHRTAEVKTKTEFTIGSIIWTERMFQKIIKEISFVCLRPDGVWNCQAR